MTVRRFYEIRGDISDNLEIERQIVRNARNWLFSDPTPSPANYRLFAGVREPPARILLAEDDADMRSLLAEALVREGHLVTECANGMQLLDRLSGLLDRRPVEPFDLIISDIRMPGLTGLEILEGLQGEGSLPPTILITAFGDGETHAAAQLAGAVVTLDKPFEVEDLLVIVRQVLRHGRGG